VTQSANVSVPRFIYGTAWKEERTAELTALALRLGFRGIDTANQRQHYFEEGVGLGLAAAYQAGLVKREDLFLQTKFTYEHSQDGRCPYDPSAPLNVQVAQSIANSLTHLNTDYVDSYVLHVPASTDGWSDDDNQVWGAMKRERDAGRATILGVSNVSLLQLIEMPEKPMFVQNRCFARTGWDRPVRGYCTQHGITYQGFSLLTANRGVLRHPEFDALCREYGATRPQLVFAFAHAVGIVPLTGTTDPQHMQEDLASNLFSLPPNVIQKIDTLIA
jgi:diketogulonate reductase-like aldo/keto reductase